MQLIAERIGRKLVKRGLIERDMDNAWLTTDGEGGPLADLISHTITYRIAVGPRAGQKLFTLQTLPQGAMPDAEQQGDCRGAAQAGGFSLHAGIDIEASGRCGGKLQVIAKGPFQEAPLLGQIIQLVAGATPASIGFSQDITRQQIVDVAQRRVR